MFPTGAVIVMAGYPPCTVSRLLPMQISCWPRTADARPSSLSKSRKGEKQRQHHGSRQPCDKDRAAQGSAENDVAAPGLLSRIRRWRQPVPVDHRKIGLLFLASVEANQNDAEGSRAANRQT